MKTYKVELVNRNNFVVEVAENQYITVPAAVTLSRAGVVLLTPTLSVHRSVVFPPEDETEACGYLITDNW